MAVKKKSKPSYLYAIIGVSMVLFLLGTLGWLVINGRSLTRVLAEGIVVVANLHDNTREDNSSKLTQIIKDQPFTKEVRYISKDQALKDWAESSGEDPSEVLAGNPLFPSIEVNLHFEYVNPDSLEKVRAFMLQSNIVREVTYQKVQVEQISKNIQRINLIGGALALLLVLAVIVLIDNTVRLAMFSNRFLIKTMQMVGATRYFISKPFDRRAIINGVISGLVAVGLLSALIYFVESVVPEIKVLHNTPMLLILMVSIVLLGVLISFISTHRSVVKYLKTRIDDLY